MIHRQSDSAIIGGVVAVFLIGCSVLPLASAPPLVDEPIFASSAFEWARSGRISISGLSAPLAIFDTVWGGLFARWLGPSYEALRWSTIVLTALSAPFFYWLLRQLRASRIVSGIGLAAYLFNPLALVLSVTFMTDMHSAALAVTASCLFVRALRDTQPSWKWLLLGSAVSSLGVLSRQHLLVPVIAALIVVVTLCRRSGMWLAPVSAVVVPPALTLVGYAFLTSGQPEPFLRIASEQALVARFASDIGPFLGLAAIMAVIYSGLIVLPLAPLFAPNGLGKGRKSTFILTATVALIGVVSVVAGRDPTSSQTWLSKTGFAGLDRSHLGERPDMWPSLAQLVLLLLAIAATVLLVRAVCLRWPRDLLPLRLYLLLGVGGFLAASVLASMTTHGEILDRYWAPLIPLTVALAIGVASPSKIRLWTSASIVTAIGLFGLIGTLDALVAQREIVDFANDAVENGIDASQFEGGASWSALTYGLADDEGMTHIEDRQGPYWVKFYAVETEPRYGVTLEPLNGYRILDRREFRSILHREPTFVYLVERPEGAPYFLRKEDF